MVSAKRLLLIEVYNFPQIEKVRSASTAVGGTVEKAECSSYKQGGLSSVFVKSSTLLLQGSELGVGARGSSLLSGHELLEGCSHVSGRGGSGRSLFFRFFLSNSRVES